jgi:hypothetical protein
MVPGQLLKEWGLIQAIGLEPSQRVSSPHSFFNKLTTSTKKRKSSKKKRKSATYTFFVNKPC